MSIFCCLLRKSFTLLVLLVFWPMLSAAKQPEIKQQFNFMSADYLEYRPNEQMIYGKGNVKIMLEGYFLSAHSLFYDIAQDKLWAEGEVVIKDEQNKIILGQTVILKDKFKTGVISDFILYFGDNTLLVSKLAERIEEDVLHLTDSTFTPCKILCNKKPLWQISARNTVVDLNNSRMRHQHLFFEVWGIPIFYTPYFSHPTPKAKAKSGILVPKVENKSLSIPLYYRALPNLDFTLTPRIFQKYKIFELEARYKRTRSEYILLKGSYGYVPYKITEGDVIVKNRNTHSYYILINGTFVKKNYNYGFRLEKVSDKAYLKNYYQNYTSCLTSKVFLHNINNYNYFALEGIRFEGLNITDSDTTDPLIFPKIRTKNVINLQDNEESKLIIENNSLIYKERSGKELGRSAWQFSLDNNFVTPHGHLFRLILRNRTDIYFISHLYPNDPRANKLLSRNIPEIQTIWRYPLAALLSQKTSLMVEPIMSLTIGRRANSNSKFSFIDNSRYEISENNLFLANRYSGIDNHEFGTRLSYGVNTAINSGLNNYRIFLGQARNTDASSINKLENIGKVSANLANTVELFYRFRKSENFASIRDEIGGTILLDKFNFSSTFVQLSNLKKYHFIDDGPKNDLRQLYFDCSYRLSENWLISYNMRLDLPTTKLRVISKTIQVTYLNDCVRIAAQISDAYMSDEKRGIKKTSLPTIFFGLKILNM